MQIFQTLTISCVTGLLTGLNRIHVVVQVKLSKITNLTFEWALEIAVNMTMVKEHAQQFHSPGGATVGASSSENVNRVRCATKKTEGRYPRQVKRFLKQSQQATMLALWRQACATGTQVQIRKMLPIWQGKTYCKVKGLQIGKSRVRSVTEELPDEQDDHFMVYSTHTVDALKSSGISLMCRCCQRVCTGTI